MVRLVEIEGVGEVYAQKLKAAGIRGSKSFLEWGASRQGRRQIAEKTGIDEGLILEWLNHVDLMRIQGVGEEYSDLLEAAGVDTVAELARRSAENLYKALGTVNQEKKLVRKMPTLAQVTGWIAQAGHLPKVLTY
jgi:predicted flap endonuclease-1-like 5' DNA nuclease